jgi:hypothetical protein
MSQRGGVVLCNEKCSEKHAVLEQARCDDQAKVNTLGFRRVMLVVDDIDEVVARMRAHGSESIGEMQFEDTYRLAYIRGPEGIIVGLSEQLGSQSTADD